MSAESLKDERKGEGRLELNLRSMRCVQAGLAVNVPKMYILEDECARGL